MSSDYVTSDAEQITVAVYVVYGSLELLKADVTVTDRGRSFLEKRVCCLLFDENINEL